MEGNFEWFLEHYNEIYMLCGECHVVIKDKQIIRMFQDYNEAIEWYREKDLYGKANLQYCNGDESGYTEYIY